MTRIEIRSKQIPEEKQTIFEFRKHGRICVFEFERVKSFTHCMMRIYVLWVVPSVKAIVCSQHHCNDLFMQFGPFVDFKMYWERRDFCLMPVGVKWTANC